VIHHEFKKVAADQVRGDSRFAYTRGEPTPALAESIARDGLLSPPLLTELGEGYELVAGAKRLAALRKARVGGFVAHILRGDPLELLRAALADNTAIRDLTPGEKARFVKLLVDTWRMEASAVAVHWAPLASLAADASHVAALAQAAACRELLDAMDRGGMDERTAVEALALPTETRCALLELEQNRLALTRSELKECVRSMADLVATGQLDPRNPFDEERLREALSFDGHAKARALKFMEALRSVRLPELTGLRRALETAAERLRAATGARVSYDASLESRTVELAMSARNAGELMRAVERLRSSLTRELADGIFEPLED